MSGFGRSQFTDTIEPAEAAAKLPGKKARRLNPE